MRNEAARRFVLVECKENSFGQESTTASQARTLLLVAGPRAAEILGLADDEVTASMLGFVVPEDRVTLLTETLDSLDTEIGRAQLVSGQSSVFGLTVDGDGIGLIVGESASSFVGLASGTHSCMRCEPETDPRPLYFMPYDPEIDQSLEERAKCRMELFKRIHQHVVTKVGRARAPVQLRLTADLLLNRAYFGMYDRWEEHGSKKHVRKLGNRFLNRIAQAVQSSSPGAMIQEGNHWKVTLDDPDRHERVMNVLTRFDPKPPDVQDIMPTLPDT